MQNLIKIRVRNMLGSKNLEAMLQIALEGPDEGIGDIINDVVHSGRMTVRKDINR